MLRFLLPFVAIVVALCALGPGASRAALPGSLHQENFNLYPVPCPANDMSLRDLGGRAVSLSALRNKVVILNFWKIDCPPCSQEKPILERIYRKYAAKGLAIVAVNLVDRRDRQVSYVRKGKYSFTFACDPDHGFSVRSHTLASGVATSFVVNHRAEAIYEVPGVPTTYLIDRKGRVVGNSVGMVNWEKGPLASLLESLLDEPPVSVASARNPRPFEGQARQGSDSPAEVKRTGPVGPVGHRGPTAGTGPQAPENLTPPKEPAPRLPFQGSKAGTPSPTVGPGTHPSSKGVGVDGARQHLVEPPKSASTGSRVKKKRPAARQAKPGEEPVRSKPRSSMSGLRHRTHGKSVMSGASATPALPVGSRYSWWPAASSTGPSIQPLRSEDSRSAPHHSWSRRHGNGAYPRFVSCSGTRRNLTSACDRCASWSDRGETFASEEPDIRVYHGFFQQRNRACPRSTSTSAGPGPYTAPASFSPGRSRGTRPAEQ